VVDANFGDDVAGVSRANGVVTNGDSGSTHYLVVRLPVHSTQD